MRGTYSVKGMSFHAFHGVMEVERELGQVFSVDVVLGIEMKPENSGSGFEPSIRGGDIYELTKNVMMGTKFKSHLSLALKIAHVLIEHYDNVTDASVLIERRHLFIAGDVRSIEAEVTCTREDYEKTR